MSVRQYLKDAWECFEVGDILMGPKFRAIKLEDGRTVLTETILFGFMGFKVILHDIVDNDVELSYHNHRGPFLTIGISGEYVERLRIGGGFETNTMKPGRIFFRKADQLHRVTPKPWCTTLCIKFPRSRKTNERSVRIPY